MPVNVLTQRNAPDRQGVNGQEIQLNPVRFASVEATDAC
jgi:hypothetical protein